MTKPADLLPHYLAARDMAAALETRARGLEGTSSWAEADNETTLAVEAQATYSEMIASGVALDAEDIAAKMFILREECGPDLKMKSPIGDLAFSTAHL